MGHTANFCWLGNTDKLNIAGGNHTLRNFFCHNLHFDNDIKKVQAPERDNGSHSEIKKCETILKLLTVGVLVGTAIFLVVRF